MFEYKILRLNKTLNEYELDKLGEDRWELITILHVESEYSNRWDHYFKRSIL